MRYYLQLLITPNTGGNKNSISAIVKDRDSGHKSLDEIGGLLTQINYKNEKEEAIKKFQAVLNGKSEVEYFGQDDVVAEIRKDITVVTNNNFDPPKEDRIETTELRTLIETWWEEYSKFPLKES